MTILTTKILRPISLKTKLQLWESAALPSSPLAIEVSRDLLSADPTLWSMWIFLQTKISVRYTHYPITLPKYNQLMEMQFLNRSLFSDLEPYFLFFSLHSDVLVLLECQPLDRYDFETFAMETLGIPRVLHRVLKGKGVSAFPHQYPALATFLPLTQPIEGVEDWHAVRNSKLLCRGRMQQHQLAFVPNLQQQQHVDCPSWFGNSQIYMHHIQVSYGRHPLAPSYLEHLLQWCPHAGDVLPHCLSTCLSPFTYVSLNGDGGCKWLGADGSEFFFANQTTLFHGAKVSTTHLMEYMSGEVVTICSRNP